MGGVISSFKDLKIWQKGIKIVKLVYVLSEILPKKEEFVLSQQMRRASSQYFRRISAQLQKRISAVFVYSISIIV